jgi:hypothetical protein
MELFGIKLVGVNAETGQTLMLTVAASIMTANESCHVRASASLSKSAGVE